jgi:UDP-N-acetylmuramate dehydrogenase
MMGWVDSLKEELGGRFKEQVILATYTSLKVGGPADFFLQVEEIEELQRVVKILAHVPYWILGNGSNVLVSDMGVRGVVIKLGRGFGWIRWGAEVAGSASVEAGAGVLMPKLARMAVQHRKAGLEFAEGIPGTLGGALVMNAGAYGGEMAQVVERVRAVGSDGEVVSLANSEIGFRYRGSNLKPGLVVTSATFHLKEGDGRTEREKLRDLSRQRKLSQPSGAPNAGSIFRNPPGDYAGSLIERSGLRGLEAGRAQVSPQHGNFIVNRGGANAGEILKLILDVQQLVHEKTGVRLEPEIRLVGQWEGLVQRW